MENSMINFHEKIEFFVSNFDGKLGAFEKRNWCRYFVISLSKKCEKLCVFFSKIEFLKAKLILNMHENIEILKEKLSVYF